MAPRRHPVSEAAHLATLLAEAFHDDPVSKWAAPDESTRRDQLLRQFSAFYDHVFLARRTIDRRGVPCFAQAVWAPPGTWELTSAESAAVGAAMMDIFGSRAEEIGSFFAAIDAHHPSEPHWYLEFLAVVPARQGLGYGGDLLKEGIRRCDTTSDAAYLWTANARNLALYRRHGFEVTWIDHPGPGPTIWGLWREPKG